MFINQGLISANTHGIAMWSVASGIGKGVVFCDPVTGIFHWSVRFFDRSVPFAYGHEQKFCEAEDHVDKCLKNVSRERK